MYLDRKFGLSLSLSEITLLFDLSLDLDRTPDCTPDLKLISFTNPFLHSHSYSFPTDFTDLNLYWIKGALLLF